MSNYNIVQPGITRLAKQQIDNMSLNMLKNKRSRLDDELYTSNVYLYPERLTQTKQIINYINTKIRNKNRMGGRRTRRNKKSKKSTRRQ